MRNNNGLSFLERISVSMISGGAAGVIRGATEMPNDIGDNMTKQFIDIGTKAADTYKRYQHGEDISPWFMAR